MSMTSLIKKKGRLLHMESMISQKTKDGLVLELVLIPLNLLWQVFEAGGSKWEKNPIQMLLNFISMLMEEEAMDREHVYGKWSYRNWQMNFKWKFMFHTFLQEQGKWNKIEHRMFSFISQNWRGRPLINRATVVNLIGSTTTKTGLKITARLDETLYQKGIKVSDKELADVYLEKENFHGEWNYKILPKNVHVFRDRH